MELYLTTLLNMIMRHGKTCVISRRQPDGYGGLADEEQIILQCKGIYHTSTGYSDITLKDSGKVSTRRDLQLIVPCSNKIKQGDYVNMSNGEKYIVSGVDDVGGLQWCLNLSLGVLK